MCGIKGVIYCGDREKGLDDFVREDAYHGLIAGQHRGQDAYGMISFDGSFHPVKRLVLLNAHVTSSVLTMDAR